MLRTFLGAKVSMPHVEYDEFLMTDEEVSQLRSSLESLRPSASNLSLLTFSGLFFPGMLILNVGWMSILFVSLGLALAAFSGRNLIIQKRVRRWKTKQEELRKLLIKRAAAHPDLDPFNTYITPSETLSLIALSKSGDSLYVFCNATLCEPEIIPIASIESVDCEMRLYMPHGSEGEVLGFRDEQALTIFCWDEDVQIVSTVQLGKDGSKAREWHAKILELMAKVDPKLREDRNRISIESMKEDLAMLEEQDKEKKKKSLRGTFKRFGFLTVFPLVACWLMLDSVSRPLGVLISCLFTRIFLGDDIKTLSRWILRKLKLIDSEEGRTSSLSKLMLSAREEGGSGVLSKLELPAIEEGHSRGLGKLKYKAMMLTLYVLIFVPTSWLFHLTMLNTVYPLWESIQDSAFKTKVIAMQRDSESLNPLRHFSIHAVTDDFGYELRHYLRPSQMDFPDEGEYMVRIAGRRGVIIWSISEICILIDDQGNFIERTTYESNPDVFDGPNTQCLQAY